MHSSPSTVTTRSVRASACDACPDQPNPGALACTVSIYAIKNGTIAVGSSVAVANALVTGRVAAGNSSGAFLQVKEGDAGYAGPDFSGMFLGVGTMRVKALL